MSTDLIKKIEELEARVKKLESASITQTGGGMSTSSRKDRVSVVEFMRSKNPTTAMDKTLVFAVFSEMESGKDTFNTEDILSIWRQAKETPPSNINDLINKNLKKGYIAEEKIEKGQKKSWYITRTGSEIVEKGFEKQNG